MHASFLNMHSSHMQLKKSNKLLCMNKCELQKHTRKSTQHW